jgi:small subunit ribosomal protein S18
MAPTVTKSVGLTPKVCIFCSERLEPPSPPRDVEGLKRFLSAQYKILPRRKTGVCSKHQRRLAKRIKLARELGLLPYHGQRNRGS